MKFQLGTDGKHPFIHGHFYNEHGPYFRGEGLEHLSDNFFCQEDALAFLDQAVREEKIALGEAMTLRRDQALLSLPEERPSNLWLYHRNEKADFERFGWTSEGKKPIAAIFASKSRILNYGFLKLVFQWLLDVVPHFFRSKYASFLYKNSRTVWQETREEMKKREREE